MYAPLIAAFAAASAPAFAADIAALYELAVENDARFHANRARYEATMLNPAISRARLLPQISLSAARSRFPKRKIRGRAFGVADDDTEFTYNAASHSLNVTQSLFNIEYYIELQKSRSEAERARLDFEAARQDLILRLAEAYFGVLSAQNDLEFARAEKEALARQLEQAQSRFEVGLDPITDSRKAEAAYDLAIADEISAANRLHVSRSVLRVITGRSGGKLDPLADTAPTVAPDPDNAGAWIEAALDKNLRLLSQRLAANIAAAEAERLRAGHYPTLDLYADRNERNVRGGPAPQTARDVEIGVRLNLPLFSGGGVRYRTRQASHLHREAVQQLKEIHHQTRQQAEEAFLNAAASVSRVAALARARESARVSYESNQAGFTVGTRSSVDVLLALEDLFDAERDYSETRHEYILNTLRLKKVAGSLSHDDVLAIARWLK